MHRPMARGWTPCEEDSSVSERVVLTDVSYGYTSRIVLYAYANGEWRVDAEDFRGRCAWEFASGRDSDELGAQLAAEEAARTAFAGLVEAMADD